MMDGLYRVNYHGICAGLVMCADPTQAINVVENQSRVGVSVRLTTSGPYDIYSVYRGMDLQTSDGGRYIVVDVCPPSNFVLIRRSTWWRRLYWRLRRLFQ